MSAIAAAEVVVCSPGRNFVTLKLTTDDGLTGLGDATLNGRELAVAAYLSEHVCPLLAGRDPARIEDTWQLLYKGAYWRRGPVTMAAIAAVDTALWDIKAKAAGMPLYQLLGGRSRDGVLAYAHASGETIDDTLASVERPARARLPRGARAVGRARPARASTAPRRTRAPTSPRPPASCRSRCGRPRSTCATCPTLLTAVRERFGFGVQLLHDVHHRLTPIEAARLGKSVEEHALFWLEDPVPGRAPGGLPADPPAHDHAARGRRGLQLDLGLRAADLRGADRLHPHLGHPRRRRQPRAPDLRARRAPRRAHRLARRHRPLAGLPGGGAAPRPRGAELRDPGAHAAQRARPTRSSRTTTASRTATCTRARARASASSSTRSSPRSTPTAAPTCRWRAAATGRCTAGESPGTAPCTASPRPASPRSRAGRRAAGLEGSVRAHGGTLLAGPRSAGNAAALRALVPRCARSRWACALGRPRRPHRARDAGHVRALRSTARARADLRPAVDPRDGAHRPRPRRGHGRRDVGLLAEAGWEDAVRRRRRPPQDDRAHRPLPAVGLHVLHDRSRRPRRAAPVPWERLEDTPRDLVARLAKPLDLGDRALEPTADELLGAAATYGAAVAHVADLYAHLRDARAGGQLRARGLRRRDRHADHARPARLHRRRAGAAGRRVGQPRPALRRLLREGHRLPRRRRRAGGRPRRARRDRPPPRPVQAQRPLGLGQVQRLPRDRRGDRRRPAPQDRGHELPRGAARRRAPRRGA